MKKSTFSARDSLLQFTRQKIIKRIKLWKRFIDNERGYVVLHPCLARRLGLTRSTIGPMRKAGIAALRFLSDINNIFSMLEEKYNFCQRSPIISSIVFHLINFDNFFKQVRG